MSSYEAPELLLVGAISGVVLGEKSFTPGDSPDNLPDHYSGLSAIDVD